MRRLGELQIHHNMVSNFPDRLRVQRNVRVYIVECFKICQNNATSSLDGDYRNEIQAIIVVTIYIK